MAQAGQISQRILAAHTKIATTHGWVIQLALVALSSIIDHLTVAYLVLERLAQQDTLAILAVQQANSTGIGALAQIGNDFGWLIENQPVALLAQQLTQQTGTTARNTRNQEVTSLQRPCAQLGQSRAQQWLPAGQAAHQAGDMRITGCGLTHHCQQPRFTQNNARTMIMAEPGSAGFR